MQASLNAMTANNADTVTVMKLALARYGQAELRRKAAVWLRPGMAPEQIAKVIEAVARWSVADIVIL